MTTSTRTAARKPTLTVVRAPRASRGPTKADLAAQLAEARTQLEELTARPSLDRVAGATAAGIPALAGALGWLAATLAHAGSWLAVLPALMTVALLRVSLPHVTRGIERSLGVTRAEAWPLGVALDLSLVCAEVVLHLGSLPVSGQVLAGLVMLAGLAASTAYNVRGFRH